MARTLKRRLRPMLRKTLKGGLFVGHPLPVAAGAPAAYRDNLLVLYYLLIMQRHLAGDIGHDANSLAQIVLEIYAAIFGNITRLDPRLVALRISHSLDEATLFNRLILSDDFTTFIDNLAERRNKRMVVAMEEVTSYLDGKCGIKLYEDVENNRCGIGHDAGHFITLLLKCFNILTVGSWLDQAGKPNKNSSFPYFFEPTPPLPIEIDLTEYGFGPFVDRLKIISFDGRHVQCEFGGTLTIGGVSPYGATPAVGVNNIRYINAISMGGRVGNINKHLNSTDINQSGFFTSNANLEAIQLGNALVGAGVVPPPRLNIADKALFFVAKALGDTTLVIFLSPFLKVFQPAGTGAPASTTIANPFLGGQMKSFTTRTPAAPAPPIRFILKTHDRMNHLRAIIKGVYSIFENKGAYEFFPGYSAQPINQGTKYTIDNLSWINLILRHGTEVYESYQILINYYRNEVLLTVGQIKEFSCSVASIIRFAEIGQAQRVVNDVINALTVLQRQNTQAYIDLLYIIVADPFLGRYATICRNALDAVIQGQPAWAAAMAAGYNQDVTPLMANQYIDDQANPLPPQVATAPPAPAAPAQPYAWSQNNQIKLLAEFNNRKACSVPVSPNIANGYTHLPGSKVIISKHHHRFVISLAMPLKFLGDLSNTELYHYFLDVLIPGISAGAPRAPVQVVRPLLAPPPPPPAIPTPLDTTPVVAPLVAPAGGRTDFQDFTRGLEAEMDRGGRPQAVHTGLTTDNEVNLPPIPQAAVPGAPAPDPPFVSATEDPSNKTSNMLYKKFQEYFGWGVKRAYNVIVDAAQRLNGLTMSFFTDLNIASRLYTEATGLVFPQVGIGNGAVMQGGAYGNWPRQVWSDTILAINEFSCWINKREFEKYGFYNGYTFATTLSRWGVARPMPVVPVAVAVAAVPAPPAPRDVISKTPSMNYRTRPRPGELIHKRTRISTLFYTEREYYRKKLVQSARTVRPIPVLRDVAIDIQINNAGEVFDPTFTVIDKSTRFFQYPQVESAAIAARNMRVWGRWQNMDNVAALGAVPPVFNDEPIGALGSLTSTYHMGLVDRADEEPPDPPRVNIKRLRAIDPANSGVRIGIRAGGQRVSPENRTIDATNSGVRFGGSPNVEET